MTQGSLLDPVVTNRGIWLHKKKGSIVPFLYIPAHSPNICSPTLWGGRGREGRQAGRPSGREGGGWGWSWSKAHYTVRRPGRCPGTVYVAATWTLYFMSRGLGFPLFSVVQLCAKTDSCWALLHQPALCVHTKFISFGVLGSPPIPHLGSPSPHVVHVITTAT